MKKLNTKALENNLKRIESYIPDWEKINPAISKVNVAWQLDHSLKVINAVVASMQKSDESLYVNNFSFLGKVFLQLNYFPRGKAKSPKHVKPPEVVLKSAILEQLATAKKSVEAIKNLGENTYFKHPLFGNVNKARVIRFLNTHTNHHLKIVKAILK